jgi:hypothetical protein
VSVEGRENEGIMKRIGIILGGIAGVLFLAFFAASILIKPEKIKNEALERIRSSSGYSVDAGRASLKVSIGGAGIRVENISFASPDSIRSGRVEDVDVLVKILPLLKRRVELKRLVLHRPVYKQGQTPPAIREEAKDDHPALAFFAAESWEVKDGSYKQTGDWGKVELEGLNLEGGLVFDPARGGEGSARGTAETTVVSTPKGIWTFPEVRTGMEFTLSPQADRLELPEIEISSGEIRAELTGSYEDAGNGWEGRLRGRVAAVAWNDLVPFLPADAAGPLEPWTVTGTVSVPEFEMRTGGTSTRTSGRVELSGFSARHREAPLGISETEAIIRFSPQELLLDKATGKVGEDAFAMAGSWDLLTGSASVDIDTRLAASALGRMLPASAPFSLRQGSVSLDLSLRGTAPFRGIPEISGRVVGENLEGSWRDLPLRRAGGTLVFAGTSAEIRELGLELGDSDLKLTGSIPDLQNPEMAFALRSTVLDLNQLFPESKESAEGKKDAPTLVALPGKGSIQVGTLKFRKFRVEDIRSRVSLGTEGIALQQMTGRLYGGDVRGNLNVRPAGNAGEFRYDGGFDLSHVQAASLILGWNPAGALVEGDLGGRLDLAGKAGKDLDPRKAFQLEGDIDLTEGALVNFSGLSAVGSALKIKEINDRRWPFRSLDLRFTIAEGNLVLESMQMTQPGIGWSMQGQIGIDGSLQLSGTTRIDPKRVSLPDQVAFLAPYMVEDDGRIPLDFLVRGSLENPAPVLDWKALTERATERAKKQEGKKIEEKIGDTLKKKIFGGGKN